METTKTFDLIPWPINGFSGIGGAEIWPKKTRFVCSYSVSIGIDLIEEALYSVKAGKRGKFDSLWSITAFNFPKGYVQDGYELLKKLKWHSQDLTYGMVCKRVADNKTRLESLEEMFIEFMRAKMEYDHPREFLKAGLFSTKRFNKLIRLCNSEDYNTSFLNLRC